jgi:hypothetical protein
MFSTEFVVAIAILMAAVLPLAVSWVGEARALRAAYCRAVAVEIVDGEIEALAAGGWRQLKPGTQDYTVSAAAATNLPPGRFTATLGERLVRLEWKSDERRGIGPVAREVKLP